MKTRSDRILLLFFLLVGMACRTVTGLPSVRVTEPSPSLLAQPTATLTFQPTPEATWTPVLESSASPVPSPETAVQASVDGSHGFQVRVHPDGGLAAGDLVSFEVIAPSGVNLDEATVEISQPGQEPLAKAGFGRFGLGGRMQATLLWVWDTHALAPGDYRLVFTVQPDGISWNETFTLLPAEDFPASELNAGWEEAHSDCCTVFYISGTAAERDLDNLLLDMDAQALDAADKMGIDSSVPITVTLLPRLLGHGGFANDEIHISYLDRNYSGGEAGLVLHHEMIHVLDSQSGGELRPSILVEGLAVYMSGGHFKSEPLMARAAALLDSWGNPARPGLGWFIPLKTLADDFYRSQHEIGYLEAGALVEYMLQTWGWRAFNQFYRDIQPDPSHSQAQAFSAALEKHFDLTLDELETRFIQALRRLPADTLLQTDVRLSVQYFDAMRRYQQAFDPSAYFLTAWLLDTSEMRKRGIVADYLRHPAGSTNLALETLLADAAEKIQDGDYHQAELDVEAVNAVLDAFEQGREDPFGASSISADYAAVVQAVQENPDWVAEQPSGWFSPQRIWIEADQARVWVSLEGSKLVEIWLSRDSQGGWSLQRAGEPVNP